MELSMKRILKILGKIFIGLIFLFLAFLIFSYWYITTNWKNYYTEEEIQGYVSEINKAPKFNDTFYFVYDKLRDNDRHKSITEIYGKSLVREILGLNRTRQSSWAVAATHYLPHKKGIEYGSFKLAWALEKYTTSEKCFDFAMNSQNQYQRLRDSTYKDITHLSDTIEIIEYLLRQEKPSYYNLNPEKLKSRIEHLRKRLNE
jgi:hypothetical protein